MKAIDLDSQFQKTGVYDYLRYSSVAPKRHHEQGNLEKEAFNWVHAYIL